MYRPRIDSAPKKSMKVLFLLGTVWGENGITSHLSTLSKALLAKGWQVGIASSPALVSQETNEIAQLAISSWEEMGIRYFNVPFPPVKPSLKNLIEARNVLIRLQKVILEYQPDIMHLHSMSVSPYAALVRHKYKIPYVSTCHLEPVVSDLDVKIASLVNKTSNVFLGNRVIAVSKEIAKAYEETLHVPPSKICAICHGVDDQFFYPASIEQRQSARAAFGLNKKSKVVALIGRLDPVKGHSVLFRAISLLKQNNYHLTVLCAGKGYGNEELLLQQQVQQLDLADRIHFLGMTDSRKVLWASDILVLPSFREASPLVIPEAMLCGVVPIRTPASGAYDQIEDGVSGFIVPFNDSISLAEKIKVLIDDEDLYLTMSRKARDVALNQFTLEHMSSSTVNLYEKVIQSV
jgi:glycosyltransferase involved in cell wall biosynthesis